MADDARQMSLIPYTSDNREILLQQGSAIVVYDDRSRQLSVRHAQDKALDLVDCPYCHRPLHQDVRDDAPQQHHYEEQYARDSPSFVDPDYFRMLAQSQRTSPVGSDRGTPARRFVQPALRSGRSRDVSGTQPLAGAEFIASEPAPTSGQGISSSAFSPNYFKQFFKEERELGRGGNGVVLLVEHKLDGVSLGHYACKRIPVGNDHRWLEKVLIEVKLLTHLQHQNLVKYHWVWLEEHQAASFGPKVPCVWILQEYCGGGDLHNYVLGPRDTTSPAERLKAQHRRHSRGQSVSPENLRQSRLTLDEIFSFFRDITSGLHHLHAKGYIHRDVKPSNCLLQTSEGRTRVLLSDFGEVQAAGTRRGNTGATGTISYCAPEVLRQEANGRYGDFTTKSDVFSLGMIVYFMCFGKLPYVNADDIDEGNEDLEVLRAEITTWHGFDDTTRLRNDLPDRLYKYLQRLLSVNALERPSTEEILSSIKANTGLADATFATENDRVTSADSPKKPARSRDASLFDSRRPFMSELIRSHSGEQVHRSISPAKGTSLPEDNSDASRIMLRQRKIERPLSQSPAPVSPRLMLPPPPTSQTPLSRLGHFAKSFNASMVFKVAMCIGKLFLLFTACSPYLPDYWVLYPSLLLALMDFTLEPFDFRRSLLLTLLQGLIFWSADKYDNLCQGNRFPAWNPY